ncbi:hypothetical protein TVAG_377930 [Trichomonas vaginalis G3]|uniref:Nucleoplasmin-like domain-containing protein n=1 Tax=Trichomonas vaginalis (strain ATCC PRA-98 / G3) TaxID=412133 RepID=A2DAY4_TRIV3|nr:nucleoplasmin core domain domain-containing protein [Trichomonas vaginalis G3]EAY22314.1 hypothetical protein TVAG_377930 [Trichomonas vaginalis G3]KAI5518252.1 nucleoplasmin core domain domain-containing protein [Trichomonas vaginalis G3]|eukprot:XP_001583300.1 hypothetical protein [Trichomonas vaginalis G3]
MESSKFWSTIISPEKQFKFNVPEDKVLVISNACLAEFPEEFKNEPTRIILTKSNTSDEPTIIAILVPERKEHFNLQFKIPEDDSYTLSVRGKGTVHIAGYFINLNEEVDEEDNEGEEGDVPEISLPNPSQIQ